MSVNRINSDTYEAYFNGCGYAFEITRDTGRWHVKVNDRHVTGTLPQVLSTLQEIANG